MCFEVPSDESEHPWMLSTVQQQGRVDDDGVLWVPKRTSDAKHDPRAGIVRERRERVDDDVLL